MVNENADKYHGIDEGPSASQVPENKLRHNFRLGDIAWVKLNGSSWWPAQVVDESCVGRKPKKKDKHDCLVRLYGTCQYLYVDPWRFNSEFEMMLKQENKSAMEAFCEVLEKELSCDNSPTDYDEEAVNTKGSSTKGTSKKNSSRKVRKQEGLKPQEGSAEDLRNKRQKHGAQSASVDISEGLRWSARTDAKEYLDAAEDSSGPLTDMHEGLGATHDAEMAYVDEVINGICGATEDIMSGSGVKGESSNVRQRRGDEATSPGTKKGNTDTTRSREAVVKTPEQLSARQIRIMQSLGLIAPSGSPFGRDRAAVAATNQ